MYKHTSPSGKVYIGITKRNLKERWENGKGYKGQVFYNAIEKYGWKNIKHEILHSNLSEEEAKNMEKMYIDLYNSTDSRYGYNVHDGGGETPVNTRKVICLNNKKVFNSIIEASQVSTCHYTNIVNCCAGRQNYTTNNENEIFIWMYYEDYLKLDYKQINKIIKEKTNHRNSYVCLNTREVFFTATEAGKRYNINRQSIGKVCLGKQKTAGKDDTGNKLVWVYYRDYINMSEQDIEEKIKQAYERDLEFTKNENYIESRVKIGKMNKNRQIPFLFKQRQSEIMIEKWKDENYRQKMKHRNMKNSGSNNKKSRKVICLNDKKIFECISKAQQWALNASKISSCCRGERDLAGKHPMTGEPLKWMYYEDYLKIQGELIC